MVHVLQQLADELDAGRPPFDVLGSLEDYVEFLERQHQREAEWRAVPELHEALLEALDLLFGAAESLRDHTLDPEGGHRPQLETLVDSALDLLHEIVGASREMLEHQPRLACYL